MTKNSKTTTGRGTLQGKPPKQDKQDDFYGEGDDVPEAAEITQATAPQEPAQHAPQETARTGRRTEGHAQRGTMNHAKDPEEVTIGGMTFRSGRGTLDHANNKSLDIPENLLNPELSYRWVNDDEKGRLSKISGRDYQLVPEGSIGKDIPTKRRVGTKKDGSPLYAHLMATPKKWLEDRRKAAEVSRRAKETRIFTNPVDETGQELGSDFYNKGSRLR